MKTRKLLKARENANDKVAIVFGVVYDWLRGRQRKFPRPITKQSKVTPKQSWLSCNPQLKITLIGKFCPLTAVHLREFAAGSI